MFLASWELNCNLFDGEECAGPVPVLFADDPEEASRNVEANPARLHADLQRLHKMFFMPEFVDCVEAAAIIRKPR
jgi:hypothetical protein